jgi:hypothetical protein
VDKFGVIRMNQAPNGKHRYLHRTKIIDDPSGSTKMEHWDVATSKILAIGENLLVRGWMIFPMSVCAGTVMHSTLIALMSSIAFGFLHATAVAGARNALMFPSGGQGGRS